MAGLAATFGSGAMTNPIKDLLKAEVILVTGSNTTENHPIFANYIKEAVLKHNAKLIVIDPRRIDLVDFSDIWLRPLPGTDVAWLNGLMHIIIKEKLHDRRILMNAQPGLINIKNVSKSITRNTFLKSQEFQKKIFILPPACMHRHSPLQFSMPWVLPSIPAELTMLNLLVI